MESHAAPLPLFIEKLKREVVLSGNCMAVNGTKTKSLMIESLVTDELSAYRSTALNRRQWR